MPVDALAVAGGRIVIGLDDLGRASIALRDADGSVVAHLSAGESVELEMQLEPGGPLVDVGRAIAGLRARIEALEAR